jgi:hypothetical protein
MVYRERVNGVVLIASTNTVGTGVVVSGQGDIVTNEHIVQDAHKARGEERVPVWFKPSKGVRPAKRSFLLAKVISSARPSSGYSLPPLCERIVAGSTTISRCLNDRVDEALVRSR